MNRLRAAINLKELWDLEVGIDRVYIDGLISGWTFTYD